MVLVIIVLPIENNRYGTGISNFYEMFLQSSACHLGLVGGTFGAFQ